MNLHEGQTVTVNYTAKLQDGTVFDSTEGRDPLRFTIGDDRIIPGFEQTVKNMEPGESRTATIPPEKAFGEREEERIMTVEKERFPDDMELHVGQQLEIPQNDGQAVRVTVVHVGENEVTLDANHPLAGQPLTFEIKLENVE